MTLTRNLYELDEVVSALQVCLRNGWPRGLFWLWELVVSDEETIARETLSDAWLTWGGGYDPFFLKENDWITRYNRLVAAIRAAGSLNAVRFLQEIEAFRPTVTPLPATRAAELRRRTRAAMYSGSKEAAHFWISYDSACRQGSRKDAIWLIQAAQTRFRPEAIWSAITVAVRGTSVTKEAIALICEDGQDLLHQVAATLILCTRTSIREERQLAPYTQKSSRLQREEWDEWTASVGTRRARVYAIPGEAIHQHTTRGRIARKYTNIGDVRDPIPLLADGCAFWRSALTDAGISTEEETGATIFPDDDVLERFYDRYFPDDIPDEWGKQDQEKSHGRGWAEKATVPPCIPSMELSDRAWKLAITVRDGGKNLKGVGYPR